MRDKRPSRGWNADETRIAFAFNSRRRPAFVFFVCFRDSKPGRVSREKAQSAKRRAVPQAVPLDFQAVPIRSQAFPNAPKQFPNDSQMFPILCLIRPSLNTCRIPRELRDRSRFFPRRTFRVSWQSQFQGQFRRTFSHV